jgi:signal peptidase II
MRSVTVWPNVALTCAPSPPSGVTTHREPPVPGRPGTGTAHARAAIVSSDVAAGAAQEEAAAIVDEQPDPPGETRSAATSAPAPEVPRRPRTRLLLVLAVAVFALDLATKLLVVATLSDRAPLRLLGGALYLTEARNTGAAFSFAEGATVVFSLIAVVVVVVIVRAARRLFATGWAVALGLVLGGAVGNLVDRIFRDPGVLRGGVVDFLSLFAPDGSVWPIFNVADSAIVCGGLLGALLAFRGIEFDGGRARDHQPADDAAPV